MSNYLLEKSCKLIQESKQIKKPKKSEKQRLKKKRNFLSLKEEEDIDLHYTILQKLKNLDKISKTSSVDNSTKVFSESPGKIEKGGEAEKEESTVFTDKDFEDFEKEYFDS